MYNTDPNSTISNLPQGLQRYTGEQDFFLVVANVTERPGTYTYIQSTLSSDPIPTPWSASDTHPLDIPLTAGVPESPTHALVNFLVPRDQFLDSPFGQAVLQDRLVPGAGSLGGPLLSDISSSLLGGTTSQQQLECYFQTNAMATGTTATTCNGQPDAFSDVKVISVTPGSNCTGTGTCGGVPSNSALSQNDPAPALQGVVALNISFLDSQYNPTSVYLDALIAGLMDNGTGGINGTFRDVTNELPSLCLNSIVTDALANQIWNSGGVFGAPTSFAQPPPPPPPSCSGLGCVWNAVSGVVTTIAGAIVGVVWNAAVAAAEYLGEELHGLASAVAQGAQWVAAATVSALAAVGTALEAALQALLAFIEREVTALLTPVFSPIINGIDHYAGSIFTDVVNAQNDIANGKPLAPDAQTFWLDVSGGVFNLILGIGVTIVIAITIVSALSLGAAFVIPIMIGLLMQASLAQIANKGNGGLSYVDDFKGLNPVSPEVPDKLEAILGQVDPYLPTIAALWGIETTSFATAAILDSWEVGANPELPEMAAVATGGLALMFAGVAAGEAGPLAGVATSVAFDGVSLILDGIAAGEKPDAVDLAIGLIDTGTLLLDLHTLG